MQAFASTRLKCLPVPVLLKAAKANTRIAMGLHEALSRELAVSREHLLCLSQRSTTHRIAAQTKPNRRLNHAFMRCVRTA